MLKYPARIHPEEEVIWLEFIDFPTCFTQGENMEELKKNAREALSLHIESMLDDNDEIPLPSQISGEDILSVAPEPDILIPLILKKFRKEMNLSQSDIAQKMGVTYQAYQRLEHPGKSNPTIKTLKKIAKAIGKEIAIEVI